MNTLTDIAYEHDRLVKPRYALTAIGGLVDTLNAKSHCRGTQAPEPQYWMELRASQTRSGHAEELEFDMPARQDEGLATSTLDRGHMQSAVDLGLSFRLCSSASYDDGHAEIQRRRDWQAALNSCGFRDEEDLEKSPYKIVGLSSYHLTVDEHGGFDREILVDYQVVDKGVDVYDFNIDDKAQIVARFGLDGFTEDHLDRVLEQAIEYTVDIRAITTNPGKSLLQGTLLEKDNRVRSARAEMGQESGR